MPARRNRPAWRKPRWVAKASAGAFQSATHAVMLCAGVVGCGNGGDDGPCATDDREGYPSGTMVKMLREDGEARTLLMKIPPGFHLDPHCHITCEQHFSEPVNR